MSKQNKEVTCSAPIPSAGNKPCGQKCYKWPSSVDPSRFYWMCPSHGQEKLLSELLKVVKPNHYQCSCCEQERPELDATPVLWEKGVDVLVCRQCAKQMKDAGFLYVRDFIAKAEAEGRDAK